MSESEKERLHKGKGKKLKNILISQSFLSYKNTIQFEQNNKRI